MLDKKANHVIIPPDLLPEVDMGRLVMANLRVTILGIVRDCAGVLPRSLAMTENIGSMFRDWGAVFYENDSTDATPDILLKWAGTRENVIIQCDTLGTKKWPSIRNPDRAKHLSMCRNACRMLAKPFIEQSDAVICFDPDLGPGARLSGLCTTFHRWLEWDGVASNGLRRDREGWVQADAWVFRTGTWAPQSFGDVKNIIPAPDEEWMPVLSAFGGLACYTRDAYLSGDYTGDDVDHVSLHRNMLHEGYARLFLNPAQVFIQPRKRR